MSIHQEPSYSRDSEVKSFRLDSLWGDILARRGEIEQHERALNAAKAEYLNTRTSTLLAIQTLKAVIKGKELERARLQNELNITPDSDPRSGIPGVNGPSRAPQPSQVRRRVSRPQLSRRPSRQTISQRLADQAPNPDVRQPNISAEPAQQQAQTEVKTPEQIQLEQV
ncbi:hypothetical protein H072_6455 [Dactylellina haptotyla CBS 200.50]|uniref:Uncharacterized protein n=1 Tax=Dactylellina haptotyla (strain CBS 200.50) TaxID=1284197 RepID=S8BK58_DACHA|nr:hypothetical protein H072_6455 [Dactylellina haptotyla CBS 200.50]